MNKQLNEFLEFVRKQGVIGLAIGFILGGSVKNLVTSLVTDIINPLLGLVLGKTESLKDYQISIGSAHIMWGSFVSNIIDFLVIAGVVYWGFKILSLIRLNKKP